MQEKEQDKESLAEQTLKRFRSSSAAETATKRRKLSRGIFFINIIILMVLFVFYLSGKKSPDDYKTATFKFNDVEFRFSLSPDKISKNHYFSLSLKSRNPGDTALYFQKNVATIVIYHDTTIVLQKIVGENVNRLILKPGETKTLVEVIDTTMMKKIIEDHPEYAPPGKRGFFQFEKNYIPLTAELTLNTREPISTSLTFKYEAQ